MQETWETWVQFLGQDDPMEEGMAAHSSVLPWRIPRAEEPGRLKVRTIWASLVAQTVKNPPECRRLVLDPWIGKIPFRRKWQPISVLVPGEPHGQRSQAPLSTGFQKFGHGWGTFTFFLKNVTFSEKPKFSLIFTNYFSVSPNYFISPQLTNAYIYSEFSVINILN